MRRPSSDDDGHGVSLDSGFECFGCTVLWFVFWHVGFDEYDE